MSQSISCIFCVLTIPEFWMRMRCHLDRIRIRIRILPKIKDRIRIWSVSSKKLMHSAHSNSTTTPLLLPHSFICLWWWFENYRLKYSAKNSVIDSFLASLKSIHSEKHLFSHLVLVFKLHSNLSFQILEFFCNVFVLFASSTAATVIPGMVTEGQWY